MLRQGITVQKYATFWQQTDFTVYFELCKPTASKIVNCFKYKEPLSKEETVVLHYLDIYVWMFGKWQHWPIFIFRNRIISDARRDTDRI